MVVSKEIQKPEGRGEWHRVREEGRLFIVEEREGRFSHAGKDQGNAPKGSCQKKLGLEEGKP